MRQRKNGPEAEFHRKARDHGFEPTKRGWPDFLIFRPDGSAFAVEVKSTENRRPGRYQQRVLDLLTSHGIPCFVYRPDSGLTKWPESRKVRMVYSPSVSVPTESVGKGGAGDLGETGELRSPEPFIGP